LEWEGNSDSGNAKACSYARNAKKRPGKGFGGHFSPTLWGHLSNLYDQIRI